MSYEQDIAKGVEKFGWTAIAVSDVSPGFVYSVGLMFTYGHPELILFGLEGRVAYGILQAMVEDIGKGRSFAEAGKYEGVVRKGEIGIRVVDETQHELYLGSAMGYCRERGQIGKLRAVQVFWADRVGEFPFERGCEDEVWEKQPRLDRVIGPMELKERRAESA